MGKHIPVRSFATAVSAFALVLGLAACAGGPGASESATTNPSSATLMQVADETAAGGDPATAAGLYRRVHDLSPKDPVPLAKLGAMLIAMQEPAAAAQAYRAAVALAPADADLHRGLALALLSSNQPDGAATEARAALEKRGDDARLYSLLGVAYDMGGHHEMAQESYRKGLALAPASAGLRNNIALSLALSGDYAGAIDKLKDIAGPEAPPRYRLNLAMAYALSGDDDKATTAARQVLDEQSVQNNLAFYALLRGMNDNQRTAAILGAEMRGGAVSPSELAAAKAALNLAKGETPTPPPPPPAVSIADLPPVSAPAVRSPPTRPEPAAVKAAAETKAPFKVALAQPERPLAVKSRAPEASAPVAMPQAAPAPLTPPPAPAMVEAKPDPASTPAPEAPAMQSPETAATTPSVPPSDPAPQMAADPPAPPVAVDPPAKTADMAPAPAPPAADASPAADTTPPPAAASADPAPAEPKVAKAEPPKASHSTSTTTERFAVQLGSWQVEATAHKVVDALGAKGINVSMTRVNDAGGRTWYVVRSGDVTSADEANSLRDSIKQAGPSDIAPVVVRVRTSHGHAA